MGYNLIGPCYTRGMGEKIVNVRIRFPESLKERVQAFANVDRRSLNSEVLTLLEEAMNARETGRPKSSEYRYPDPSEHRATGRLVRAAEPALDAG